MEEKTASEEPIDSRVDHWVSEMEQNGDDFHQKLAGNYEHYLSNINSFEDGELDYTELPNFTTADNLIVHESIKFGIIWAKEANVFVVTEEDGTFNSVFGHQENAESESETSPISTVHTTTPIGTSVEEKLQLMRESELDVISDVGETLEYLIDHSEDFENGNASEAIDAMPKLEKKDKLLLVYSALFGRLWEASNPSLWVVLDVEDETYHGVHATPESAAQEQQSIGGTCVEAITPVDNDRYCGD